jgi:predicted nucleic acid-binding protein
LNVLVDTSVWSLALRRKSEDLNPGEKAVVSELSELIREGRARIFGLVRQELLSGIKTVDQFERLKNTLRSFPDEAIHTSDYEAAAKASNACRLKGGAVSVVDILICAFATARDWPVFTTDPDFQKYASIIHLKLHVLRK